MHLPLLGSRHFVLNFTIKHLRVQISPFDDYVCSSCLLLELAAALDVGAHLRGTITLQLLLVNHLGMLESLLQLALGSFRSLLGGFDSTGSLGPITILRIASRRFNLTCQNVLLHYLPYSHL